MSHFTVAVFTKENGKTVKELLAPFHEFECTGNNDQYVKDIDKTLDEKEQYENNMVTKFKNLSGELIDGYDERLYREPTPEELKEIGPLGGSGWSSGIRCTSKDWNDGKGYRAKIRHIPDEYIKIEIPQKEIETFAEYLISGGYPKVPFSHKIDIEDKHKYGYFTVDRKGNVLKVITRTNPNAEWDWYQIGGRWSGMLKLKPLMLIGEMSHKFSELGFTIAEMQNFIKLYHSDFDKFVKIIDKYGEKKEAVMDAVFDFNKEHFPEGSMGEKSWTNKLQGDTPGFVDSTKIKNIDFSVDKNSKEYKNNVRFWELYIEDETPVNKEEEEMKICFYQKTYYTQRYSDKHDFARQRCAITTYSVITPDGRWHSAGKMGWFGCVSDSAEESVTWNKSFYDSFIKHSDPEWCVTIVDCHT